MVPSQSVGTFEYEAVLLVLPVGEEGEPGVDTSIIWIEFTRSRSSPADPGTRRLVLKFLRWSISPQKLRLVFSKLWGIRLFMELTPATRISPCSCPSSSAFAACRSTSSCGRCLSDRPKNVLLYNFSFLNLLTSNSPHNILSVGGTCRNINLVIQMKNRYRTYLGGFLPYWRRPKGIHVPILLLMENYSALKERRSSGRFLWKRSLWW